MNTKYPYLVLHKVRGEPAFDIAEALNVRSGTTWIIRTSGHRAYPYRHCSLWSPDLQQFISQGTDVDPDSWNELEDHYDIIDEQKPIRQGIKMVARAMLNKIGLSAESKSFQRRRK